MPNFDVEAFVTKLDSMGMKLTAIPLADGKLRINRWRMLSACEHAQQIQDLWTSQVGNDQERIDVLAAHLADSAPRAAGYSVSANRLRIGSSSMPAPDAATEPFSASDSHKAVASQSGPPPQKLPARPIAMVPTTVATSQPVATPSRAAEKAADDSKPIDVEVGPELQKLQRLHASAGRQTPAGAQVATAISPMSTGARTAAGQPMRPGVQGATVAPRSDGKQAALERQNPVGRQNISDPRGAGGVQKVAVTPPPGGLQKAQ